MKYSFLTLVMMVLFFGCKTSQKTAEVKAPDKDVEVVCIVKNCTDSLRLMQFEGIYFKPVRAFKSDTDTFRFKITHKDPRFYYVGLNERDKKAVILGGEHGVVIMGDCKNMRAAKVSNSETNDVYQLAMQRTSKNNSDMNRHVRSFQKNYNNPAKRAETIALIKQVDQAKLLWLDSIRQRNPFVARVTAIDTYQSFFSDSLGYSNEVMHYANSFFRQADIGSSDYNQIPYLFEGFKNYAQTLASVRLPKEQLVNFLDSALIRVDSDSRAYRYALGGVLVGLQAKNNPAYMTYGNRFVEKYEGDNVPALASLKQQVQAAKNFEPGAVAPDFTQNTPDDEALSLSELKGKVVLVDFWASWCGPCRKENPHVVRLYNKYKEQGFEILGVSLDKKKDRWLKAIEKDGLTWKHVSDLKGWQNSAAQLYSVRSIPHTVLLDREGRILGRNLRGAALDNRLKELFNQSNN